MSDRNKDWLRDNIMSFVIALLLGCLTYMGWQYGQELERLTTRIESAVVASGDNRERLAVVENRVTRSEADTKELRAITEELRKISALLRN